MKNIVLPGLYVGSDVHVTEAEIAGARVWLDVARRTMAVTLVPDLSQDVLMTSRGPMLTNRTINTTNVVLAEGTAIAGARLPIAATSVRLDRSWSGWRSHCRPEEILAEALTTGAIAWTRDRLVSDYVEAAAAADLEVSDAARAAFVSERTLRRRLVDAIGVGPTTVRRVLRLHRLAQRLQGHSISKSASLAGYADQSHAARDVRKLTGMSVGRLARYRLAD